MSDPAYITFIDEFTYRGRPDGASAWHISLGAAATVAVTDPWSGQTTSRIDVQTLGPLTVTEAEALGYSFATVIAGINTGLLTRAEALERQLGQQSEAAQTLQQQLEATIAERDRLQAALAAREASDPSS